MIKNYTNKNYFLFGTILFILVISCGLFISISYVSSEKFTNNESLDIIHDPSQMYEGDDGYYYGYGSGSDGMALKMYSYEPSSNKFTIENILFPEDFPEWSIYFQEWNPTGEFDAPSLFEGRYVFYTVFDEKEGEIKDAIALAENIGTFKNPDWLDRGIIVESFGENNSTARAMDPSVVRTKGQVFLIFGSHAGGIYVTELNPETLKLIDSPSMTSTNDKPDRFRKIAWRKGLEEAEIEASYIFEHGEYYYLFVNWGRCCNGIDSTYNIRVGRSDNIYGPYKDKDGTDLVDGGGTLFKDSSGDFIGPGHAGISRLNGRLYFSYHYYDKSDNGNSHLALEEIFFKKNDWPVLGGNKVSSNH